MTARRGPALLLLLTAALPAAAQPQECLINPWDPQVQARLAPDRRALELRTQAARCRIELDCTVRAAPTGLRYELATLVKGRIPPTASLMRGITFEFADGATQACRATGATTMN